MSTVKDCLGLIRQAAVIAVNDEYTWLEELATAPAACLRSADPRLVILPGVTAATFGNGVQLPGEAPANARVLENTVLFCPNRAGGGAQLVLYRRFRSRPIDVICGEKRWRRQVWQVEPVALSARHGESAGG